MRWRNFLHGLGHRLGLWKEVCVFLSGFATVPSFLKFSDSVRLVYLKKFGVGLADGVSIMGIERATDMAVTSLVFLVLVGKSRSVLGVVGVLAVAYLGLKTRKWWFNKMKAVGIFRGLVERVESYVDATVASLKKLRDPWVLAKGVGCTLGIYVLQLVALSAAVGVGPWTALPAYLLGWVTITASPTPAGLGFYEAAVSAALAGAAGAAQSLGGVLVFRFVVLWLPVVAGQVAVAAMPTQA